MRVCVYSGAAFTAPLFWHWQKVAIRLLHSQFCIFGRECNGSLPNIEIEKQTNEWLRDCYVAPIVRM